MWQKTTYSEEDKIRDRQYSKSRYGLPEDTRYYLRKDNGIIYTVDSSDKTMFSDELALVAMIEAESNINPLDENLIGFKRTLIQLVAQYARDHNSLWARWIRTPQTQRFYDRAISIEAEAKEKVDYDYRSVLAIN